MVIQGPRLLPSVTLPSSTHWLPRSLCVFARAGLQKERDEGWWWVLRSRPGRSMFVFHIPLAAWPQLTSLKAGK